MSVNISAIRNKSKEELVNSLVRLKQNAAKIKQDARGYADRGLVAIAGTGGAVLHGVADAFEMTELGGLPVAALGGAFVEGLGIVGVGGSDVTDFAMIAFGSSLAAPELSKQVSSMLRK